MASMSSDMPPKCVYTAMVEVPTSAASLRAWSASGPPVSSSRKAASISRARGPVASCGFTIGHDRITSLWSRHNKVLSIGIRSRLVNEDFDVIVVGARCAGSPLAASLATRGMRVCLVDRARFPSEVPSTHMIHPSGVASLGRLGILDRLLATGAPPLDRGCFVIDDVRLESDPAVAARFEAPWLCIRRVVLDSLLVEAAEDAGAQVRTETPVVGLVEEDGAVRGVRTRKGVLNAAVVVGADGPHSAIARFVGAREY